MKRSKLFPIGLMTLASVGWMLPQGATAAGPQAAESAAQPAESATAAPAPAVSDVALHAGGALWGQAVDAQGQPLVGVQVSIRQQGTEVRTAITDASGRFAVNGLNGGTYQLLVADGGGTFRLWATDTAPPAAQAGALVVGNGPVVRGELAPPMMFLTNPWVVSAAVATAIAVPIAVSQHHNGDEQQLRTIDNRN